MSQMIFGIICGMKIEKAFIVLVAATLALGAAAEVNVGADFRLRQEIMDNIPGNPGYPAAVCPAKTVPFKNQIRIRPRAWFEIKEGPFRLYTRVADEFREYPTLHTPRKSRAYNFPDELFLDNLYLDGSGLEAEWLQSVGIDSVDFRIGRQDMVGPGGSIFGLNRLIFEGTPTDGSRDFFSDMVRTTLHFDETKKLDLFALYDNGENYLRWGNHASRGRSLNCINMTDSNDLDEWGGGAVFSHDAFEGQLPYKVYGILKGTEPYTTKKTGERHSRHQVTTIGLLLQPEFNEYWGAEIDNAIQEGEWMNHLELKYHPDMIRAYKGTISLASTYYSKMWDPLWGRYTQDSEMLVYGAVAGNCYWSNVIYSKLKLTMNFGKHHAIYVYTGPMFVAEQDGKGHADNHGGSMYKGWLSAARYDFPLRLAPKGATGFDRIELFGHIVGEHFQPGDYYDSSKGAYFVRWQLDFRF